MSGAHDIQGIFRALQYQFLEFLRGIKYPRDVIVSPPPDETDVQGLASVGQCLL